MGREGELLQEEEPEGEKSILHPGGLEMIYTSDLPRGCQYAALGHLHRGFPVSGGEVPAVYSGSPAAYSMNEQSGRQSVILGEIFPGGKARYRFEKLKTPWPLYRETFKGAEPAIAWLRDHQEGYVELTLKTKEYIKGSEKQKILQSHPRILSIIPEREGGPLHSAGQSSAFLTRPVKELFRDYYRQSRQDLDPPEELLSLLDEILNGEED